jgi:hypothetical protein
MNELGLNAAQVAGWFPQVGNAPYVLVQVSPAQAGAWAVALRDAVRRCYLSDDALQAHARQLAQELGGTDEFRQGEIIKAKLPDAGATMAGDFGEILVYTYQATKELPATAFGPKKWRLKQDRTKPAPYSDVIHFVLPAWPNSSAHDQILCAEVKMKSTNTQNNPIDDAIQGCTKDRTSRLAKTLQWLKERALTESLGQVQLAHLNRFIDATGHSAAAKQFRAVAVICAGLLAAELQKAPAQASPDFSLVVIAVPNLHAVYNAVFDAARTAFSPAAA